MEAMQTISSKDIIASWFVADDPLNASDFPQTGHDSSREKFQQVYWRCVVGFYATLARQSPNARKVFFTNLETLPKIGTFDIAEFFSRIGVEVITLRTVRRLGSAKVKTWNNQFFILDIIEHLASRTDFETVMVLDADCVWVRSPDAMVFDVRRRGILSLSQPYPESFAINGVTRPDMMRAAALLAGRPLPCVPHYSGGELFAATAARVKDVWRTAEPMWQRLLDAAPGEITVTEEGQFLSIIYEFLDVPVGTADPHCRRLWTALRLNNVSMEDKDSSRCVWHLPMEKKTGFADLFRAIGQNDSWVWTTDPDGLREIIAKTMGIPRRSGKQWLMQVAARAEFYREKLDKRARTS
ncbi:hypothetical protein [Lichenibacterium ramalinae]|uniref:hypothetical protein n=1 Tax=Lichenibacterium ramalinae TaxID=2316527 RepID=UPI00100DE7A7|nr:hypothetical protein [Lichenibacterium ramalinae]